MNRIDPTGRFPSDSRAATARAPSWRAWIRDSRPQSLLSLPFIYGMAAPLVLLDLSISVYQAICFPLYGIARVRRRDFMAMDRHRLPYLNAIERVHCAYCGYANGVLAFAREVTARTEQYWCPIRHARPLRGTHARYRTFAPYGDAERFRALYAPLRAALAQAGGEDDAVSGAPVDG